MSAVLAAEAALRANPMKMMKIPSPTTSASSGIIALYLDGDHSPDDQVAYEDHETADCQQDPADDASEHRPKYVGVTKYMNAASTMGRAVISVPDARA